MKQRPACARKASLFEVETVAGGSPCELRAYYSTTRREQSMRNDHSSSVSTSFHRFWATLRAPRSFRSFAIQSSFAAIRNQRFFAALTRAGEGNPARSSPLSPLRDPVLLRGHSRSEILRCAQNDRRGQPFASFAPVTPSRSSPPWQAFGIRDSSLRSQ